VTTFPNPLFEKSVKDKPNLKLVMNLGFRLFALSVYINIYETKKGEVSLRNHA